MPNPRAAAELPPASSAADLRAASAAGMTYRAWLDAGRPITSALPEKRAKTGTGVRPYHPYRNKWEHDYAKRLDYERALGIIRDFSYETERLTIGEGATFLPDFPVTLADGTREMREVKGYRREAAMVRIRVAARLYPHLRFVLVTKVNGEWVRTTIGAKR